MAPERKRYTFKGPGVTGNTENRPKNILPRPERGMGIKKAGRIIAAALALQAPLQVLAYERISTDKRTAIVASAGTLHHRTAGQVAPKSESPLTTATTISQRREIRPAPPRPPTTTTTTLPQLTEPANEQPTCIDGWETLSDGVCIAQFREFGSDVHAVRVDLKNPNISVRPAFVAGPDRLGRLSDAVEKLDAIVGINASFIVAKNPVGPMAAGGEWLSQDTTPQQVLIVNNDNTLGILPTEQALREDPKKMKFALSGSHVLVQNGIAVTDFGPDNPGKMLKGKHRRTAIGVNEKGELIMIVTDGLNMQELALIMAKSGVLLAINLDGGGSSGMVTEEDGQVSNGKTRPISTVVVVRHTKQTAQTAKRSYSPTAYPDTHRSRKKDQNKNGRLKPKPHPNPPRSPRKYARGRR